MCRNVLHGHAFGHALHVPIRSPENYGYPCSFELVEIARCIRIKRWPVSSFYEAIRQGIMNFANYGHNTIYGAGSAKFRGHLGFIDFLTFPNYGQWSYSIMNRSNGCLVVWSLKPQKLILADYAP